MSKSILVIDDELDLAESMSKLLAHEGYTTHAVAGATAGLEFMRSKRPDLVIVDVMMPVIKGTDFVETIRQDPQFKDVKILLMSASPEPKSAVPQWNLFLRKPFDIDDLLEIVRGFF